MTFWDHLTANLERYLRVEGPPWWAERADRLDGFRSAALVHDLAIPAGLPIAGTEEEVAAAFFNPDRTHRYLLLRLWDRQVPPLVFLLLNPSTADAFVLDPTVTRCVARARALGYGGCAVLNLFALRATDPRALVDATDRQGGPLNDEVIAVTVRAAVKATTSLWHPDPLIVCGWGTWGSRLPDASAPTSGEAPLARGPAVVQRLQDAGAAPLLRCLAVNGDRSPKHPLYVRAAQELVPYFG